MLNGKIRYMLLALIIGAFLLDGCKQQIKKKINPDSAKTKNWNQTIQGNFSQQTQSTFDSTEVNTFLKSYPAFSAYSNDINTFYKNRKYAYAWFENGKLIEQAGNLSNRINNLEDDGIYKTVPYQKKVDSLIYANHNDQKPDIQVELMLTAQYFVFSKMTWQGLDNSVSKSANWFVPRKKVDYNQFLDSLLKTPAKSTIDEPVYRQYDLLKSYLAKYRALDAKNDWTAIASSKTLKPGDSSTVISQVKSRLFKLEDYKGDTTNNKFDTTLSAAVKHFQSRTGLLANGQINKTTLTEMNVPLKMRIQQILVNMERSRWLPVSLKGDYLAVNIPEFKLHVYNGNDLLWSCNVVVGKVVNQTTIFYGEINNIVFSPYWNVPNSIIIKEILPGMRSDRNYIAKHNMEITGYAGGLPVVRQKPGIENSLGLVKFLFPNSYSIYLHDTPSKSLFGESSRAFSHGCIRVSDPVKLATFLLKNYPVWTPAKINAAMHSGKEQYVTIKNKVPVFITYFTAFVDRDGALNLRKDIYNHDDQLASMIMSGSGKY